MSEDRWGAEIILPLIIIFISSIFNFFDILNHDSSILINQVILILYIVIWISAFVIVSRNKNRLLMKFYSLFWLITLITTIILYLYGMMSMWLFALFIITLSPWFGVGDYTVIAMVLSILFFIYSVVWLIWSRNK